MITLPKKLLNDQALQVLIDVLLEKEDMRKSVGGRMGHRVKSHEEGERLLLEVKELAEDFLGLKDHRIEVPRLILKHHLARLPRQSVKLHALYWSIGLGMLVLNSPLLESGAASWMVKGSIIFMFAVPSLISRRVRLNLEHQCGYVNILGHGTIYIHQLPYPQFQSFLAHEYAHHLFFHLNDVERPGWVKEGWARYLQWMISKRLYEKSGNGAYLIHVLDQVVGEIKFACQLLAAMLLRKLPWKVRRISTIYNVNPLWRLLTGNPGFDVKKLITHSIGTAGYFWAERNIGLDKMIENKLFINLA